MVGQRVLNCELFVGRFCCKKSVNRPGLAPTSLRLVRCLDE